MKSPGDLPLRVAPVAIFTIVHATALLLVQAGDAGPALWFFGLFAVAAAAQAVVWGPEGLTPALLLSLAPLVALGTMEGGMWLIGPLAALLLLASELILAGWDFHGAGGDALLLRRRVGSAARIAAGGALASLLVVAAAGFGPSLGGTVGLLLAAVALAGLGWVLFGRGRGEAG